MLNKIYYIHSVNDLNKTNIKIKCIDKVGVYDIILIDEKDMIKI